MTCIIVRIAVGLLLLLAGTSAAVPQKEVHDHNARVHNKDYIKESHEMDGHHNPGYDQAAVFGDSYESSSALSPEESIKRLGNLFHKMDENSDGYVTAEELYDWLRNVQMKLASADTNRSWTEYKLQPDEFLTWERHSEYAVTEGDLEGLGGADQKEKLERDRRRWDMADLDKDGKLSLKEASRFLFAEWFPDMHPITVKETIEELDKNKNGVIELDEFIADLYTPSSDEPEPDWIASERDAFRNKFDKNGDGMLDESEVNQWLFPESDDMSKKETDHLLSECDQDGDTRLSKTELEQCHDLAMSSAATGYGELLNRHEEL